MALPKIETPTYVTRIPSTKKSIKFRPYVVKEENVLMMALESEDPTTIFDAILDVISACTFETIDPRKLTLYDIEYLFLQLRIKSVGEIAKLEYPCTAKDCKKTIPVDVNLEDAQIVEGKKVDQKVMVTDNIGIILRHPTIGHLLDAGVLATKGRTPLTTMLGLCIEQIFQGDDVHMTDEASKEELDEFIGTLPRKAVEKMEDFIRATPKLQQSVDLVCECGHKQTVVIEGLRNFFTLPYRTKA